MARTEETALSALLGALGKGVMQLPVEMEKQKEVQRQNALQSYSMMQQQQQQQMQQQESMLRQQMTKLQMQELNEKIRAAAMEPYMTEEQRMAKKQAYELEQIKQRALYDRQQAESVANINNRGRIDVVNARQSGGMDDAGLKTFLGFVKPLITANEGIKATNAKTLNTYQGDVASAQQYGLAVPPMPDTLAHLDLSNLSLPVLQGLGVDSSTTANILGSLSPQQTPAPQQTIPPMPATWKGTQEQWIDYLNRKAQSK